MPKLEPYFHYPEKEVVVDQPVVVEPI